MGQPHDPAHTQHAAPSARTRVLVIDDDPLMASVLSRVLRSGHEVVVEHSARRALARIDAGEFYDAVVCDVMMPDLTGADFFDQLTERASPTLPRVVFVTGGSLTPRTTSFLATVPNPVLYKPFNAEALRAEVARIVDANRAPPVA